MAHTGLAHKYYSRYRMDLRAAFINALAGGCGKRRLELRLDRVNIRVTAVSAVVVGDCGTSAASAGVADTVALSIEPRPVQEPQYVVWRCRERLAARLHSQRHADRGVERDHGVPPPGGQEERRARWKYHDERRERGE